MTKGMDNHPFLRLYGWNNEVDIQSKPEQAIAIIESRKGY
jgi:hypothetical protein